MKRYANIRLLAAVALLVATAGCKDDEGPALKQPALLSIQDAAADAEVITVESPKKQTLNIRVEAEQISGNYITVVFKTDPELVETYNAAHGTSYKLCPSEAYAFSTTEVMLPRYNTVSSTMKVELFSERMPDEEPYLLPIAIDSIKGDPRATVSPTGNVRYILFNKFVKPGPPAPVLLERSGWKVLAAPKAKPNYEVEKMFDEDINTFGYCNADEEQANALRLRHRSGQRGDRTRLPVQSALHDYRQTGSRRALRHRPLGGLDREGDHRRRPRRSERRQLDLHPDIPRLQDRSRLAAGSDGCGHQSDARRLPACALRPAAHSRQLYEQDL